jgi:hypothetical protein
MATNKRELKAYVRFDGLGKTVSSSLIWRKNKPNNVLGTFSNPSGNIIQLVMSGAQKTALCPEGVLTFDVIAD